MFFSFYGRKKLTPAQIDDFFRLLSDHTPQPVGELHYTTPYTLLVAVVLSAQSTDIGVNKATLPLFKIIDHPQKMLDLGEKKLRDAIKTIGLFNSKARHIIALSRMLVDEYHGDIPKSRAELEKLPGVGRKTANVVLNIAFGHPTIAVDTHIFRISNRTDLAPGKNVLDVEKRLEAAIPQKWKKNAHLWLILLGRYICKARKPLCGECPVMALCAFEEKNV